MSFLQEIQPSYRSVYYIPLSRIQSRPSPPRGDKDEEKLFELASSIRQWGLLQPVTLRATENGYEIILGERRVRACILLGFTYIDAFVLQAEQSEAVLYSLLENMYQRPLHFLDEAAAYTEILESGTSMETIARQLGKSVANIEKKRALVQLFPETQRIIRESGLSERHARALLPLNDAEKQSRMARQATQLHLSPLELEALVAKETANSFSVSPKRKIISMVWEPRLYLNAIYSIIHRMREAGLETQTNTSEDDTWSTMNVNISRQK